MSIEAEVTTSIDTIEFSTLNCPAPEVSNAKPRTLPTITFWGEAYEGHVTVKTTDAHLRALRLSINEYFGGADG